MQRRWILWAVLLWLMAYGKSMAQVDSLEVNENDVDSSRMLEEVTVERKKKPLMTKVVDGVNNFFMGCDTTYVTPQKYQLTAQAEVSYWHDYYFMRSSVTGNTMVIQSDPSVILGGYVYYRKNQRNFAAPDLYDTHGEDICRILYVQLR